MHKNWQMSRKKRWRSYRMVEAMVLNASLEGSRQAPSKLLSRCDEVTMKQFMACICDNNLNVLDVNRNASIIEKAEAWSSLISEYSDHIEGAETKFRSKILAEIVRDEKIDEFVTIWVWALGIEYKENIANAIRKLDFEYELNPEDPEQYQHDLARITAELRSLRLDIKFKKAQYSAILESKTPSTTSEDVERKYFEQIFQAINNYRKWNCVNEQSSVLQFCVALKSYNDEITELKKSKVYGRV